jgi:hypothetical protein
MNYESKIRRESTAFPGVAFVLKKMTEGRRIKFRMAIAGEAARLREILVDQSRLRDDESPDPVAVAKLASDLAELTDDRINPAWVRWGLAKVEGLEIDGEPCKSADQLIEDGPPELYLEILAAIQAAAGMSESQLGESESHSTSGGPVEGEMSGTTAELVDEKVTT